MKNNILTIAKDPMGAAIADFYRNNKADRLRVLSSMFDEDEFPVEELFRTFAKMSPLEQKALQMAHGQILDVGAGAGCHSLELQNMGKDVTAIDISPASVETMKLRGVKNVMRQDLLAPEFTGKFDTILMLMNGSGIIGTLDNMPKFFERMKQLLRPGGEIIMDSSDLKYLYENEDGSFTIDVAGDYYGQVDFQMQYKDILGDSFDWLYIDFDTLSFYANQNGFKATLIQEGDQYDYLASLSVE